LTFYLCLLLYFVKSNQRNDNYADDLKILNNIQINKADELTEPTKIKKTDFFIYNSFQPGLYTYVVWTGKIEKVKDINKSIWNYKNYLPSVD